jgi:hypothetical protein
VDNKIFYKYIFIKSENEIIRSLLGEDISIKERIKEKEHKQIEERLSILTKNEFHFSIPDEFNDPFDSRFFSQFKGSKAEWEKYANNNFNEEDKIFFLNSLKEVNYKQSEIDMILRYVTGYNEYPFIVCCFSASRDNILMWSHYANQHKGICLGFRSTFINGEYFFEMEDNVNKNLNPKNAKLCEVKYQRGKPNIYNPVKKNYHSQDSFYLTKSGFWNYEQEYRILVNHKYFDDNQNRIRKRNFKFKKEILSEVIFGVNTDSYEMGKIYKIIQEEYLDFGINVKVYKAFMKKDSYEIDLELFDEKKPIKYLWNIR